MKKLALVLMLVLMSSSVLAMTPNIEVSESGLLVYPKDKSVQVTVVLEYDWNDDIEDINYKLTVSGPARFEGGSQSTSGDLDEFSETHRSEFTLLLEDTSTDGEESINLNLAGTYVKNSFFGGGKKDISVSKQLSIISNEKGGVLEKNQILQQEKEACQEKHNECLSRESSLKVQITGLETQNMGLMNNITRLESELSEKTENPLTYGFWLVLVLLVVVLVMYLLLRRKFNASNRELQRLKHQHGK